MPGNPYLDRLTVIRIIPLNNAGNLRAFATVQLGRTLLIHSVKIIRQAGQRAYVRLPDQKRGDKWYPVVEAMDKRFFEAVQDAVLAAWEKAVHENKNHLEMRGGRL